MSFSVLRIILISSVIVMCGLAIAAYTQMTSMISSSRWVEHTNAVRISLEQVVSYAKDGETGERGYIITGDANYLRPYNDSKEEVRRSIDTLTTLIYDNPDQQQNLARLNRLVGTHFEILQHSIDLQRDPTMPEDTVVSYMAAGRETMDALRRHVRVMLNIEMRLLDARRGEQQRYFAVMPQVILGVMLFCILLIALAGYRIYRDSQVLTGLNEHLRHSNKELSSFNYIASHDLQEPLRKIQTYTELIRNSETEMSDRSRRHFSIIQASARRMRTLINDLLAFSRLTHDAGAKSVSSLDKILAMVLDDLSLPISESGASIRAGRLPSARVYPTQIQQVFTNLISNSLKYRRSDIPLVIEITYALAMKNEVPEGYNKTYNRYHKITFTDNGQGFDPAFAHKVFELFQRLHDSTGHEGSGIGLAICQKIMSNHRGFIAATAIRDQGATFTLYLPA